jgi:homoserine O-acetyltransferase
MPARTQELSPAAACQYTGGVLALPAPFRLESGQSLERAQLAWQCAGPARAPLVIVLGGISAHARCCTADGRGWWEAQCGEGRALDAGRYRLLGVDWLGGADGSTSAAGAAISSADQARAILLLVNRLGARQVHLLVGASYGGGVAQHLRMRSRCGMCSAPSSIWVVDRPAWWPWRASWRSWAT